MQIGLVLGSGSARGWAHIGVIDALAGQGIRPEIICGTSIGALVGASYVAGNLDRLEAWVRSLTRLETARFFEVNAALNGLVNSRRLRGFLGEYVAGEAVTVESCAARYAAVATDLHSGREVWLTEGPILEAVWASISLPGLFPAIRHGQRWLVDGGLVNPVPVSVCRALGADVVIAVNLNGNIVGKHARKREKPAAAATEPGIADWIGSLIAEYATPVFAGTKAEAKPPGLFEAIAGSVNIMQDRITRSRMAGDPPDIVLVPRLAQLGLLEFFRAEEAIAEGRRSVERMLPEIQAVLEQAAR